MIIHTNALTFVDTIGRYFTALERGDVDALTSLFSPGAIIDSPWFGRLGPEEFFERLSGSTHSSAIDRPEVFVSAAGSQRAMSCFTYQWTLKDGSAATFPCSDVFEFARDGRISALAIVYDVAAVKRSLVESVR